MSKSQDMVVRRFTGGAFGENGYVVSCARTGEGILVDPGASVDAMLKAVEEGEVAVKAIVLTHAHIDHIDGVAAAKRATGAPVYLHPADEPLYRQAAAQAQWFGVDLETPPPVDEYLREGTPVRFGECEFEVRHTPGHAPGHVVLVGDGVAIVGDCVFAGSIGRTDLPGGDFQTLMKSIRTHILTLPDVTVLYSGHGGETTVGHERVSNPFLAPQLGGSNFA
ncbi:MAG TPA: MBL fold metallo-hydrolase [Longimicrobiaceae bacterium]|nr:MBL fold metallo-hydrolase [Longimicrobiaceae bacterium]